MNKNTMPNPNNDNDWITHAEYEERRDANHKEHEKEILTQGIFMGIMVGCFLTAIMIHFLEKL